MDRSVPRIELSAPGFGNVKFINFSSLNMHAINIVTVFLDFFSSRLALMLRHCVFILLWGTTYAVFHSILWLIDWIVRLSVHESAAAQRHVMARRHSVSSHPDILRCAEGFAEHMPP